MSRRLATLLVAALWLTLEAVTRAAAAPPRADWRVGPPIPAVEGRRAVIDVPPLDVPALITFEWARTLRSRQPAPWTARVRRAGRGTWRVAERGTAHAGHLQRVVLPPSPHARRVELRFRDPRVKRVDHLAVRALDPAGDNDVWLFVGASIQARSIRHGRFNALVRSRFGGDPVALNRAVGGWTADRLRKELPALLEAHPYARYVAVHVGGNDVSGARPFPRGSDALRRDLDAIVETIRDAGRVPILARLSYRAYTTAPAVPPDDNGAAPYVREVYDPVIARACPDFVDPETGLGVVDAFGWFKAHRGELLPDGVHPTKAGERSFERLWAEGAGEVVYRRGAR